VTKIVAIVTATIRSNVLLVDQFLFQAEAEQHEREHADLRDGEPERHGMPQAMAGEDADQRQHQRLADRWSPRSR
jgi:hypothetical protein